MRRRTWAMIAAAATVAGIAVPIAVTPAGATTITAHGTATAATYSPASTQRLTLSVPAEARAGDLLVASLGVERKDVKTPPVLTAPSGWTLVLRAGHTSVGALAVFTHLYAGEESGYTWTTDTAVGGVAFLAAFAGVDPADPVDVAAGHDAPKGTSVSTPSVTTTIANTTLVASYFGHREADKDRAVTWTPPVGAAELGDACHCGQQADSASVAVASQAAAGVSGRKTAVASVPQDWSIAALVALRPDPTPQDPDGPTPLIVDTDIFSDAGDVGALGEAFALELRGEAEVIAIGVNTRLGRHVAPDSWRCAAAVAQFYGFPGVPIGADLPADGTEANKPDFIAPCARLADPSTPLPGSAVSVYRRALAGAPDGSVVVAAIGYSENLAALLASPADPISPLTGAQLVARKVRELDIMAGGYPARAGENNLVGNPGAAQSVASGWPTRIVWAGYEVGDRVHTGATISTYHPGYSPVRAAYEAFVGPGNWIYSYDLVAVYHAVRPSDALLGTAGPGTNMVRDDGSNEFVLGAGDQYYLTLDDTDVTADADVAADRLDTAIETLLDTVPPPPATDGPDATFDDNTLSPRVWETSGTGSTVAAANGELEITHPGGEWTNGTVTTVGTYDQTGRAVQVQLVRAANKGQSGASWGETSVFLWLDPTHYAEFWVAGGALSAWVRDGSGEHGLTPSSPAYVPSAMQWLRFREDKGVLYWEYASTPGDWTLLASAPDPFPMTAVHLRITAGANTASNDVAAFDNISTVGPACAVDTTISADFNATPLNGGSYLWLNAVLKASGLGSSPVTIGVRHASVLLDGTRYPVPDSTITYDPAVTVAALTFDGDTGTWVSRLPLAGPGNQFLSGLTLPVPAGGLPGGIKAVSWSATVTASAPGVSVQWKWAAAVYSTFGPDYGALLVKPVDSKDQSAYPNADHAGTPEAFKPFVVAGARGGGAANYTGSYSGSATVNPVCG